MAFRVTDLLASQRFVANGAPSTVGSTGMPLVFAMNEASEHERSYEDIPYVSYEFPSAYRRQVLEGEPFVYYRGRKRRIGGRQPQVYLGVGIVGTVVPSQHHANRFICQIVDGSAFPFPVPFKDASGAPLEAGGARRGYYQRGVRRIPETAFQRILQAAGAQVATIEPVARPVSQARHMYARPETARAVEDYSRAAVQDQLLRQESGAVVVQMALNNPGYDLWTNTPGKRFIEVKGTQAQIPRFFLSEGERAFALKHTAEYALAVVYGIDLAAGTHRGIVWRRGALHANDRLTPHQWLGELDVA